MTQFCVNTTARRSVTLEFDAVLLSDEHCTGDMGELHQKQIIAHHNQTLNGFDADNRSVALSAITGIDFAPTGE